MSCRTGWNRERLESEFTKTFLNGPYKKCREALLFDRQRALLPVTQPVAERQKTINMIHKDVLKLKLEQKAARQLYDMFRNRYTHATLEERDQLRDTLMEHTVNYLRLRNLVALRIDDEWITHHQRPNIRATNEPVQERREFIKACPSPDCRGFLSTQWKCGLCNIFVCPDCHEIKGNTRDAPHTCDANIAATVALLKQDTKQCPKCPAMIYKILGCDQMWCTQCNTPFSWRTGRVETGLIHNPHYYDYMRRKNGGVIPRNPGDIPCGGNIDYNTVLMCLDRCQSTPEDDNIIRDAHRMRTHIEYVELDHYVVNHNNDNEDLRVKYLLNEITEDQFKKTLQIREKCNEKKADIHMILTMYIAVVADILNRLTTLTTHDELKTLIVDLNNIKEYTNSSFVPISKRYNCVVPFIAMIPLMNRTRQPPPNFRLPTEKY
jgi:hypothetical protein